MSQEALRNTMFPVGDLLKKNVKKIASEIGLDRIVKKKEVGFVCCLFIQAHQICLSDIVLCNYVVRCSNKIMFLFVFG